MQITTKQLRMQPGRIISQINNGQDITITYRGKPRAKIIAITKKNTISAENSDDELFGLWKNRNDFVNVEQYIRKIRKGRYNDN